MLPTSPHLPPATATFSEEQASRKVIDRCGNGVDDAAMSPSVLRLRVELKKRYEIDDFLKKACVESILFHILYSRGVIPSQATHLLHVHHHHHHHHKTNRLVIPDGSRDDEGSSSMKKRGILTQTERKTIKCGAQLHCILEDLDKLFGYDRQSSEKIREGSSGVKSVVVTLGPSFASPREQYVIRFHSSAFAPDAADPSSLTNNIATSLSSCRDRLEKEMSRRCVREFLRGTLQDAYSAMFSISNNNKRYSSTRKVNIAVLLNESACRRIFDSTFAQTRNYHIETLKSDTATNNGSLKRHDDLLHYSPFSDDLSRLKNESVRSASSCLLHRFVVQRNFAVKTPRMLSKKKAQQYRPFVLLNVIPSMVPPTDNSFNKKTNHDDGDAILTDNSFNKETNYDDDDAILTTDFQKEGDVWIALKSTMKGYRL